MPTDPPGAPSPAQSPPLSSLRVLEFGGFAAGPVVGKYLANYGAEVVRVESRLRLDGFRSNYPPFKDNIPGTERAGIFNYFNDGKYSVTLNLKTDGGVDVARRLAKRADVLIENFTPGTIDRLGLGYQAISAENPGLVMLSTCNQGQTGPHSGHAGFGTHLTSLSGFTYVLGYPDREPSVLYGPYIDYVAVGYGTLAVIAALVRRQRTGRGSYVDLSQYESGTQFVTPALLNYFVNGHIATREGNRDPASVPHGVYPCRAHESWVALSVWSDEEWLRLVDAMGSPAWAREERYQTVEARKEHEDDLDSSLATWTAQDDREVVVERLRAHRVHVYPVNSMEDLFNDRQLAARQHWRPVEHPVLGHVHVAAPPFLLQDTPPRIERAAPLLGGDNDHVLKDLLGLSQDQVEKLSDGGALE